MVLRDASGQVTNDLSKASSVELDGQRRAFGIELPRGEALEVACKSIRPGWQTSEFWKSLMVTGVGVALIFYGVTRDHTLALEMGAAMSVGSSGLYVIGRGIAKRPGA